jgi:hypothetical protein
MMSMIRCILVRLTRRFQDGLDFVQCKYREIPCEKKEECEEQTDGSNVHPKVDMARVMHAPRRWEVVSVQRRYYDHISLKPHSDVHHDGNDKGEKQTSSQ